MNKTKIEWCDYSINPVKGLCPMACTDNQGKEYCYARRMYKRFKWNPEIQLEAEIMSGTRLSHIKASRLFVGSTIELFGEWVKPEWLRYVFDMCKIFPKHTFIFLTKQPQNLLKWSPFPDNCWVGVSPTNETMAAAGCAWLSNIEAKVKFLSIEPLLNWDSHNAKNSILVCLQTIVNWIIIGTQTPYSLKTASKLEWVREIVEVADKAGIPIFLKNNLTRIISGESWAGQWVERKNQPVGEELWWHSRQEFPK